jgi:hypothetical protein
VYQELKVIQVLKVQGELQELKVMLDKQVIQELKEPQVI